VTRNFAHNPEAVRVRLEAYAFQ